MKKLITAGKIGFIVLSVLFGIFYQVRALAYVAQPDSNPVVSEVHVNRNLYVTGDEFFYGKYYLPYASTPNMTADQTFIFELIATDNTTILGATTPYVYFNSGYNYGCFGFYFPTSLTWGTTYTVRISENPAQFTAPVNYNYVMQTTDYSTKTSQNDNRAEVWAKIITITQELQSYYTGYTLTQASAGGTVLASPQGETYFRGAIPGIQLLCPQLFLVQVAPLDYNSTNWTTARFDTYEARFNGTWVGQSENATATQFHMTTGELLGGIIVLPLCVGAVIMSQKKYQRTEPGLIASSVLLMLSVVMGWLPTAIFASINQALGIYIAYLWFWARG